jgi:hypothetical protein
MAVRVDVSPVQINKSLVVDTIVGGVFTVIEIVAVLEQELTSIPVTE